MIWDTFIIIEQLPYNMAFDKSARVEEGKTV